jgi:hypothetical protein
MRANLIRTPICGAVSFMAVTASAQLCEDAQTQTCSCPGGRGLTAPFCVPGDYITLSLRTFCCGTVVTICYLQQSCFDDAAMLKDEHVREQLARDVTRGMVLVAGCGGDMVPFALADDQTPDFDPDKAILGRIILR